MASNFPFLAPPPQIRSQTLPSELMAFERGKKGSPNSLDLRIRLAHPAHIILRRVFGFER
jgi:hypothetical protein